jgi:hypothetical protein
MGTDLRRRVWTRPIAGLAFVAVIGAGLGSYFGIRAVAGAGSSPAAGQPQARTSAAMAFDAANGTVVLFGGESRSRSLNDTWTWDGSTWTEAHPATSPPRISGAQMTYDPITHDLLLVGGQRLETSNIGSPVTCSGGGSGSSSGSSGSSGSGGSTTTFIPPRAPIPDSAKPAGTPVPAIAPDPGTTVSGIGASTGCAIPDPSNNATWLWNGSDWTKASGTAPFVGFGEGSLATDAVSGRVVLLSAGGLFAEPAIACPLIGVATTGDQPSCPPYPIAAPRGWTWDGTAWKAMAVHPGSSFNGGSPVVQDAVTGRLAMFNGGANPTTLAPCPTCKLLLPADPSPCCSGTESLWDGTGWKQSSTYTDGPPGYGGTLVGDPTTKSDLYLTSDGQTWVWTGVWKHEHPSSTPPALDGAASAYDAASGQVVRFGGLNESATASGLYDQTWTWDGSGWTIRGGSVGPRISIPIPSPESVPPSLPCPTAPPSVAGGPELPQPQIACGGSDSPGGAPAVATASGVALP